MKPMHKTSASMFLVSCMIMQQFFSSTALGWTSEQAFLSGVANAIANREIIVGSAFYDELSAFSAVNTNTSLSRTILLVDAFRKISLYETAGDAGDLAESMDISSNMVALTASEPNEWHFWGSRMLLAGGLALAADEPNAYATLTNAICTGGALAAFSAGTNIVMRSLINAFDMDDLSGDQAFEALAGVAAAISGHASLATNHVANLPPKYRRLVGEAVSCGEYLRRTSPP